MRPFRRHGVIAGMLAAGLACGDLDVTNTNAPDRNRALSNASDVELLIRSSWLEYWNRTQNRTAVYRTWPLIADEFSGTYANDAALELASEPRVTLNNNPTADAHASSHFYWVSFYTGLSSANDGLSVIDDGLVIRTVDPGETTPTDNTHRARTFAKFVQGLSLGYLSLAYDQGFVATEETDLSNVFEMEYEPYTALLDQGIASLEEMIELTEQQSFVLPSTWINGLTIPSDELARIAHSYIARFLVLVARTPQQRAETDWDRVLFHIERGITQDHAPLLQSGVLVSNHLNFHQLNTSTFSTRADNKLLGPADVSGNYQAWIALPVNQRDKFLITTPDRRVTGPTPTSDGTIFRYRANEIMDAARGLYHRSWYQWYGSQGRAATGTWPILSVWEMRLYEAEARFFKGQLQEAVDIINASRATGQLESQPVTTAGVPDVPNCVPRRADGTCADLYEALQYERMIMLSGMDATRTYFDSRGFGRLVQGTMLQFPIPARELITLGREVYTFGGIGGSSAAPHCTVPTLTCLPSSQ